MRLKSMMQYLHPDSLKQKWKQLSGSVEDPLEAVSRMDRRRQLKESKLDHYLFRFSLYAFGLICFLLAVMPFIYFLPWEQAAEWIVYFLLGALFLSFSLSAVTIRKQSKYVKLPYMWAIMIFSILLLLFYLFILIYFRLLLP
ncbi:hypothetical protein [Salibacterium halotolerans]|uniref:Uncharacterized protein n=1 Tax=Salibacterium halotolerans TaxID=1884432 RepID=A0A1I5RJT5_9BACI|nr:hypothetical protein [Salibacterium halotolerans]SFP58839.1 hypothetical protein SAMN05518683_10774 [Salibacterium halotolerans]